MSIDTLPEEEQARVTGSTLVTPESLAMVQGLYASRGRDTNGNGSVVAPTVSTEPPPAVPTIDADVVAAALAMRSSAPTVSTEPEPIDPTVAASADDESAPASAPSVTSPTRATNSILRRPGMGTRRVPSTPAASAPAAASLSVDTTDLHLPRTSAAQPVVPQQATGSSAPLSGASTPAGPGGLVFKPRVLGEARAAWPSRMPTPSADTHVLTPPNPNTAPAVIPALKDRGKWQELGDKVSEIIYRIPADKKAFGVPLRQVALSIFNGEHAKDMLWGMGTSATAKFILRATLLSATSAPGLLIIGGTGAAGGAASAAINNIRSQLREKEWARQKADNPTSITWAPDQPDTHVVYLAKESQLGGVEEQLSKRRRKLVAGVVETWSRRKDVDRKSLRRAMIKGAVLGAIGGEVFNLASEALGFHMGLSAETHHPASQVAIDTSPAKPNGFSSMPTGEGPSFDHTVTPNGSSSMPTGEGPSFDHTVTPNGSSSMPTGESPIPAAELAGHEQGLQHAVEASHTAGGHTNGIDAGEHSGGAQTGSGEMGNALDKGQIGQHHATGWAHETGITPNPVPDVLSKPLEITDPFNTFWNSFQFSGNFPGHGDIVRAVINDFAQADANAANLPNPLEHLTHGQIIHLDQIIHNPAQQHLVEQAVKAHSLDDYLHNVKPAIETQLHIHNLADLKLTDNVGAVDNFISQLTPDHAVGLIHQAFPQGYVELPAGGGPWSMTEHLLNQIAPGNNFSNEQLTEVARNFCIINHIQVPEWGLKNPNWTPVNQLQPGHKFWINNPAFNNFVKETVSQLKQKAA